MNYGSFCVYLCISQYAGFLSLEFMYTTLYFLPGEKDIIFLGDFNLEPDQTGELMLISLYLSLSLPLLSFHTVLLCFIHAIHTSVTEICLSKYM